VDESHIEHPICFIEYKYLEVTKADIPLTNKVEKSTRSGNEDIDSFCECICLFCLTDSSENDGITESAVSSVSCEALSNLDSELTSRSDDKCFDLTFFCRVFLRMEKLENGNGKSGSLACTSLSTAEKISSAEDDRNSLFLYRSRYSISLLLDCFEDWFDDIE
jgi:hypothetical protein